MIKGILFALAACFVWGLIFIVPSFIRGFDAFEVALGRHGIYGLISGIFFIFNWKRLKHCSWPIWRSALLFALVTNIIYYSCLVVGVRYASPPLTALILGLSPIVISFYGNWLEKECHFQALIIPSLLIFSGLLFINLPVLLSNSDIDRSFYLIGILAALIALIGWSWYVVSNSRFLKQHPSLSSSDWATVLGTATFIWVVVLGFAYEGWQGAVHWQKFVQSSPNLWSFLSGCAVLGIFCSWVGGFLWNKASLHLPVSLAGQLTIFETLFGILFFYLLEQHLPPMTEIIGILLILAATIYSMNAFNLTNSHANSFNTN